MENNDLTNERYTGYGYTHFERYWRLSMYLEKERFERRLLRLAVMTNRRFRFTILCLESTGGKIRG